MDKVTCKSCNEEFANDAALHRHIRKHKLHIPEYYQNYWPRYDKFDGKLIEFRNKEQYFSTDFNDRNNLRGWIQVTDQSVVRAYARAKLETRKDKKGLIYTPSQVELRTTMLPPITSYDRLFGNYYELCAELGLKNRFHVTNRILDTANPIREFQILVDNREQRPLSFTHNQTEWATIKFGDYACSDSAYSCDCHIERKSAPDFVGTYSGGYDRFCREMDRCVEAKSYMVVLVEETLYRMLRFNYMEEAFVSKTRVNPEFIFHNIRKLIQTYENLQFLFVEGREEAARIIKRIFNSNCSYKNVDLQLLYDTGAI
jgi:hypothetical protein